MARHAAEFVDGKMTFVLLLPIFLAILCGAGLLAQEKNRPEATQPMRMAWLDDAYAYASDPLFEEEATHERQT